MVIQKMCGGSLPGSKSWAEDTYRRSSETGGPSEPGGPSESYPRGRLFLVGFNDNNIVFKFILEVRRQLAKYR